MSTESQPDPIEEQFETVEQPEARSGQAYELLERERRRDSVRLYIVLILLAMFAATIVFVFVGALFGSTENWNNVKDALQVILPVEASLLGSAITFYYVNGNK